MQAPSLFRDLVNLVSSKPVVVQSENATEPYWTVAQEEDRRVEMEAPSLFGEPQYTGQLHCVAAAATDPTVLQLPIRLASSANLSAPCRGWLAGMGAAVPAVT